MSQHAQDELILSLWAGPGIRTIRDGYVRVADYFGLSAGKAKRAVHRALERRGTNPHISYVLVRTWLYYHRVVYGTARDLQ